MRPVALQQDKGMRDRRSFVVGCATALTLGLSEAEGGEVALFAVGDRVIVSKDFFWAAGAVGTIAKAPPEVTMLSGPWDNEGLTRQERSALGEKTVQWVWFDEPQRDADGDGPFRGGQIWVAALRRFSLET